MDKTSSKQSLTRPPIQRMMKIHAAIKAGGFPNANALARELEVAPRSIARDIDFMRDRLQLPIAYDARRWGYYYTESVGSFPSLQISEGEIFSLLVAEKAMEQYRGTSFEKPLVSALRKLSEALPDTVSVSIAELDESISFRTSAEPLVNLEIFDELARATSQRQQLRLSYRKPGGKTGECRVIDPYHLANVNGEWFLFAYCHLRKDIRTFVPSRISAIEKTGVTFQRASFSLKRQLRDSFGVHSGKDRHDVVIRFDDFAADYIREKKWHPSQRVRPLRRGGVELKMRLSSLAEVRRWILSWGSHARVLAPAELAQDIAAEAARILQQDGKKSAATRPKRPAPNQSSLHPR